MKNLSRKQKILQAVKVDTQNQLLMYHTINNGVTTQMIGEKLSIDRSNTSRELNTLVKEGILIKIKGKPTQYLSKEEIENFFNIQLNATKFNSISEILRFENSIETNSREAFKELIGWDESLKEAITKSKASILYPPNGLATLITGESGVGKSLFAEKMYSFGVQKEVIKPTSPFITFNCADYADNQELLLSQLFGYVKGSFTGALEDKEGLVGIADGGVLFLDEVHRLSDKGQEMLFSLMDHGEYRKLGQVGESSKSKVRIIAATTEKPSEVMLNTFLRRIPVHIRLVSLNEKSIKERFELISYFFEREAQSIKQNIFLSRDILTFFLLGKFKGNIGNLKSNIQFACAGAFLRFISENTRSVVIELEDVSTSLVEQGYLTDFEDKKFIYKLSNTLEYSFTKESKVYSILDQDYYSISEVKIRDFYEKENSDEQAKQNLKDEILQYMNKLANDYSRLLESQNEMTENTTVLETIINKKIKDTVSSTLAPYLKDKEKVIHVSQLLAYHVGKLIPKEKSPGEFVSHSPSEKMTQEIFEKIETESNCFYSIVDKRFFSGILERMVQEGNPNSKIGIVIIMHGDSTASSMAKTVNQLLQVQHAKAIDMVLTEDIDNVYKKTKELVLEINEGDGVLILGDMGSILSFGNKLQTELGIQIRTLDRISTPIAIEATNYVLSSKDTIDVIYSKLLQENRGSNTLKKNEEHRYFDQVLIDNLSRILSFIDPEKVFDISNYALKIILEKNNLNLSEEFLVKFIFHCSCMVERSFTEEVLNYENPKRLFKKYPNLYHSVIEAFEGIEEYFGLKIAIEEVANVMDMIIHEYPNNLVLTHIHDE
ncbi:MULTISPECIES: sigma 54-interacting transcriptional regulator [Enterococcaceae]|uniref:Transcription antiterminator BglG n=2 Tax=Enterococcaceae TaxID=81852 RepID=A0A430A2F5_9ENTE|nr:MULTISPECIES: sigma 54-interacting transcriptional regulator [Enterococcaceae]EJE4563049.1 sigma 54-interacting transcriptional regulator [Enterococcus faecium]EJX51169.1 Sigma-54 interaction domain protein [Enterococcus faecium R497]EKY7882994.1 sigma 54-interacting transcriptional regulator [Enterococcus faecium]EKZ0059239.1 sigma 54-interacting transcriptional regulator [Enterococcus faecium]EKZ0497281.1 sigma 54-interacting transcriptional regulator [Enterococcus faecium]